MLETQKAPRKEPEASLAGDELDLELEREDLLREHLRPSGNPPELF
ncbi:MAG: hypothetical protein WEB57_06440 [Pseudohongiellaceae bacterium]